MNCHVGGKQERAVGLISANDRLNITQAVCGYPGDGQRRPLMWLPSDKADKEGDASAFKVGR